ncbi:hypothetical protein [Streptomyces sp. NBC_00588]|uniref:hypothetical protein n=1 Tax=Streptomyces sp. NBC_00588 TaxID=2975784 RepID=UPI002E80C13F|nr:hypothetical protein [Streptomyces sp. NBC_00588]WUB40412.1 hypothetical protein OHN38_37965 [Streptomyces sp. NBC_00588]
MMHEPDREPTAGNETSPDMEVLTGPGGADREPGLWRRRSRRSRAVIAAATVVVLALGGTVAYAATSGDSGQGATPSASGSASPSPDGPGERHGGRWFGAGGMGVHGEATVKDPDTGKWIVRTWQRGTVEKIDGDQVTVKSDDGAQWTWTVNSDTTVLRNGTKGSGADDLKKDETAFLIGTLSDNDTRTATHALTGTWNKHPGDMNGRGDGHNRFPGHRNWHLPAPSTSPSENGATT